MDIKRTFAYSIVAWLTLGRHPMCLLAALPTTKGALQKIWNKWYRHAKSTLAHFLWKIPKHQSHFAKLRAFVVVLTGVFLAGTKLEGKSWVDWHDSWLHFAPRLVAGEKGLLMLLRSWVVAPPSGTFLCVKTSPRTRFLISYFCYFLV